MKRLRKWLAAFLMLDRIAARQNHHGKAIHGVLTWEAQRGGEKTGKLTRAEIERYVNGL